MLKIRGGLEIRGATGADAPGLSELFRAAGRAIAPRVLADRLDALRQRPGAALIAVAWGPPGGVIILHWYRSLLSDQATAQITTLLVAPEERRKGVGRLLLKAAAQAARVAGCDAMEMLDVPPGHDLGAFCRATGFNEAGTRLVRGLRKNAA